MVKSEGGHESPAASESWLAWLPENVGDGFSYPKRSGQTKEQHWEVQVVTEPGEPPTFKSIHWKPMGSIEIKLI